MPEASIDENGDLQAWPCKIGTTRYGPLLAITAQAVSPEDAPQCKFGGSVIFGTDRGHDLRPNIA